MSNYRGLSPRDTFRMNFDPSYDFFEEREKNKDKNQSSSFLDAIGNAVGYGWILLAVAFFRELFGSGKLFGYQVFPDGWYEAGGGFYLNNNLMILPPMALIVVGLIIWVQRSRSSFPEELLEEN